MKTRYPNVTIDPDRHGKLRARFRKAGHTPKYMATMPDQPGFEAELHALREPVGVVPRTLVPRSVGDLCARYYRSADFASGGAEHRARRRGIIESFRSNFERQLVSDFGFEHIEAILLTRTIKRQNDQGRTVGGQVAAFNLRKQLRRLFAFARKLKWITVNPVEEAGHVGARKLEGFYPWSEDDIAQYQLRHPVGSRARLALEIILWTGQRRGDARLFGPRHIVRGKINFRASKNGQDLWMPLAPDLRTAIDAMASIGILTFLVTENGKTFSKDGFGNKMREWCDRADLARCTAHGLRKAIARRMALSDASQQGIKAVGGWKGDDEVSLYVASAEQEGLADVAMSKVVARFSSKPTP